MNSERIISVCKRENNPKRNYLLVNRLQGKHVAVRGGAVKDYVKTLYDESAFNNETTKIVIGFAETATALGALYCEYLVKDGNKTYFCPTTREVIDGEQCIYFDEAHSHAVEQKWYYSRLLNVLNETCEIIFVEDEVTTGNTIYNAISKMMQMSLLNNVAGIYIASLSNGMTDDDVKRFEDFPMEVEFSYIHKLESKQYYTEKASKIEASDKKKVGAHPCGSTLVNKIEQRELVKVPDCRAGVYGFDYMDSVRRVWCSFSNYIDTGFGIEMSDLSKIRIIGTEECMYPAIIIADELGKQFPGADIKTHSTTRSPIDPSDELSCAIKDRTMVHSFYDTSRKNYIYNSEEDWGSDLIIFVTDTKNKEAEEAALNSLVGYFKDLNCGKFIEINI